MLTLEMLGVFNMSFYSPCFNLLERVVRLAPVRIRDALREDSDVPVMM